MSKEGSTISGLMPTAFAHRHLVCAMQYGVPLQGAGGQVQSHALRAGSGFTRNAEIPMAKSIMDYLFRWLATKFLSNGKAQFLEVGVIVRDDVAEES